jgi:hypothetical protein
MKPAATMPQVKKAAVARVFSGFQVSMFGRFSRSFQKNNTHACLSGKLRQMPPEPQQ